MNRIRWRFTARTRIVCLLVLIVALLGGCAAISRDNRDLTGLAGWRDVAEAPVERFEFSHLRDWYVLEARWLLLDLGGSHDLAVELRRPCINDAREARFVRVSHTMPNLLHRQADRIHIDGYTCQIETIQPIPARSLRADRHAAIAYSGG